MGWVKKYSEHDKNIYTDKVPYEDAENLGPDVIGETGGAAGEGQEAKISKLSELAEILHGQRVGYVDFKNIYLGWGGAVRGRAGLRNSRHPIS